VSATDEEIAKCLVDQCRQIAQLSKQIKDAYEVLSEINSDGIDAITYTLICEAANILEAKPTETKL